MALIANNLPAGSKYGTPQELLDLFAENLTVSVAETSSIVIGSTAPTDVTKVWIDTSAATPVVKVYINTAWTSISVAGSFASGLSVSGGNIRLNGSSISIDNAGAYSGRVGIGTQTPTTDLDVNGGIKGTSVSTPALTATGANGSMTLAGNLTINAGTGGALGTLTVANNAAVNGSLQVTGAATANSLQIPSGQAPAITLATGGAISGASLNVSTGNITGGVISGTSLNVGTGAITCGPITSSINTSSFHSVTITNATTATSATAGTNGALPNAVAGYLTISINGTTRKIPYYNT